MRYVFIVRWYVYSGADQKRVSYFAVFQVSFFNNYLLDPKRPTLPEHPGNKPQGGGRDQFMGPGNFQGPPQQNMMGYNQPRPPVMGYGELRP